MVPEKTAQLRVCGTKLLFLVPQNVCTSSALLSEEDADVSKKKKKKKKKTNNSDGNARTFRRGARARGVV